MKNFFAILFFYSITQTSAGQHFESYVIDVGAGLCVIISMPNTEDMTAPYYMLYDTGNRCIEEVQAIIPAHHPIELLILSHTDSDHIGGIDEILENYSIKKIVWSGFQRPGIQTWNEANQAIQNETEAIVRNLGTNPLSIGSTERFGDTYITYVAGFHTPPDEWGISQTNVNEYRNAGSIVIRVVYKNRSILLTGDIVGREMQEDFQDHHVIASEKFLVDNQNVVPIDSDLIVAPHHGSEGASSYPFIRAVSPEYVIFSSGSQDLYGHPRATTAQRYLNSGVPLQHIFRTDWQDDENHIYHWEYGVMEGNSDPSGDDDILITISQEGTLSVSYTDI